MNLMKGLLSGGLHFKHAIVRAVVSASLAMYALRGADGFGIILIVQNYTVHTFFIYQRSIFYMMDDDEMGYS